MKERSAGGSGKSSSRGPDAMLAYLFWHWPKPDVETGAYEQSLGLFHERLTSIALDGFYGSATFRVEGVPWADSGPRVYEDWYLLEDSFALDLLDEIAVSGSRQEPHDRAARAAAGGAGGLYRLRSGEKVVEPHFATWLTKPPGTSYQDFYTHIEPWTSRIGTSLWRRQMVLGPAPEFCLLGTSQLQLPAILEPVTVKRAQVWPPVEV
jgi:hypothetical protein